jgi:hypothetical protein
MEREFEEDEIWEVVWNFKGNKKPCRQPIDNDRETKVEIQ